jgi:hypothetical protein
MFGEEDGIHSGRGGAKRFGHGRREADLDVEDGPRATNEGDRKGWSGIG